LETRQMAFAGVLASYVLCATGHLRHRVTASCH